MYKVLIVILSTVLLSACSKGIPPMVDRTHTPCGNKPNCVSTVETREKYMLAPFILRSGVTLDQVERVALTLSGAQTAEKTDDYLRIECTSRIMRFVDDLELKIEDGHLLVRSESRVGYSDFGVNRRRAAELREKLTLAGLIFEP
jgi:uncharacterized protein (DUF1499 family)